MSLLKLFLTLAIGICFFSCKKDNKLDTDILENKTKVGSNQNIGLTELKAFYGRLIDVPLDSIQYDAKNKIFSASSIDSTDNTLTRAELEQVYTESIATNIIPGRPGYEGYPTKWYWNFIGPKSQPSVRWDLRLFQNAIIRPGFSREFGFELRSPNGKISLQTQADGNMYIKNLSTGKVLWDAGSYKKYGSKKKYKLTFQTDGNLVIYTTENEAIWSTGNLYVPPSDPYAINTNKAIYLLQDDGNFVLYYQKYQNPMAPFYDPYVGVLQPIAHSGTNGSKVSKHWEQIK